MLEFISKGSPSHVETTLPLSRVSESSTGQERLTGLRQMNLQEATAAATAAEQGRGSDQQSAKRRTVVNADTTEEANSAANGLSIIQPPKPAHPHLMACQLPFCLWCVGTI